MRIDDLENLQELQTLSEEELKTEDKQEKLQLSKLDLEELRTVSGGIEIDPDDDIFLP